MRSLSYLLSLSSVIVVFGLLTAGCGQPAPPPETPAAVEQPPAPATPQEKLTDVKKQLEEVKVALTNVGKYACCVEPGCDWCALEEGECKCRDNIEVDKEVCAGCGLGWHDGKGSVEGVNAKKVKWSISHSHENANEHKH
ncbi:MAG: hypothetical protein FJY97_11970 [candidate division Zixibacteria bacterium]|nr:hypothetical protein [candidate division Zixibacteria bacterium]